MEAEQHGIQWHRCLQLIENLVARELVGPPVGSTGGARSEAAPLNQGEPVSRGPPAGQSAVEQKCFRRLRPAQNARQADGGRLRVINPTVRGFYDTATATWTYVV